MDSHNSKWSLIKQNMQQFLAGMKSQRELRKNHRWDKLARNLPADNSSLYEDFAPESEISGGEEYIRALHWALKNQEVQNIALAGPYGSGKSSIIRTYLKHHPSIKALNISLAAFDWEKKEYKDFKHEIEAGVLKQLFYKVDSRKIPQSRYRKIQKQYYVPFVLLVAIAVLLFLAGVWFFFPQVFENGVNWIVDCGNYHNLTKNCTYFISIVIGVLGILAVSYFCKWVAAHLKIKEIKIADKATVSDAKEDESVFDRDIDEIIYFFEETPYDTVFIEDLDRFDSPEIFVKLRELNTILNNSDLIKRRIVFVYAVRDDMFRGAERTKFFDFIIPVIPIVNVTNSGEKLREKLKVAVQEDGTDRSSVYDISSSYITQVAPFIEDMRVLTGICNEFVIYKNTLGGLHLKDEELFSLIIFKNLFPTDFAELEAERGIVKKAFGDKKAFVSHKIQELKEKNEELLAELEKMDKDVLSDLTEVKAAFLNFLTESKGSFNYCTIGGKTYSYAQIMLPDFPLEVFDCDTDITVYYYNENGYGRSTSIKNLGVKTGESEKNYLRRFEYFQRGIEDSKENLKYEMEINETAIMNLHAFSLKFLLEKYGAEEVLSDEVRENKVLLFLLRRGFMNENYADYMNYFHPHSITRDEMNYIRGIRMEEAAGDFSYRIKNAAQVCERIEDYEFRQAEAWNYDITDYLLERKNNDAKCINLFAGLAQGTNSAMEFIKSYVERGKNIPIFIKILCGQYPAFWSDIYSNESFSEDSKFKYLSLIFSHASEEDIVCMNQAGNIESIRDFIQNRGCALAKLKDVKSEKMIRLIECLNLSFIKIDIRDVNSDVLDYIFEEYQYELNMDMITSIYEYKYPQELADLKRANYSTIRKTRDVFLETYIELNFEKYVAAIVLNQDENVDENIDAVEAILEKLYKDKPEICKAVLDKEAVVWKDFRDCCCGEDGEAQRNIWNYVLLHKRIDISWHNFMCYYERYSLTSDLAIWFSEEADKLLKDVQAEDVTDQLMKEIMAAEDISLIAFEKFIKKFQGKEFINSLKGFNGEKIGIIVKERYIPFNIALLDEMKKEAPDFIKEYVVYNKEEFFESIEKISLDTKSIAQLWRTDELDDGEKLKLFDLLGYADVDRELALDIGELTFAIPKPFVEAAWDVLEVGERYQLFLNQLEAYSLDEISGKLLELEPAYQRLSDRTKGHKEHLQVDNTGYNSKLLNKLKDMDYLTIIGINEREQKFVVWVREAESET